MAFTAPANSPRRRPHRAGDLTAVVSRGLGPSRFPYRALSHFLGRDIPELTSPEYVDLAYTAVRDLLRLRLFLDGPGRESLIQERGLPGSPDPLARMALSVLDENTNRLVDATADLYVAVSRWLGLPAARERIRTRFSELSDRDQWSAGEDLPPG